MPELAARRATGSAQVTARDVREARFPVVLGGYDLAEVDAVLRQVSRLLPDPEAEHRRWTADAVAPGAGPALSLGTARRGYAREDVDAFLVRCAHSLRERVAEVPELAPLTAAPRTGEPLTTRDVDAVQFRLVRGGYAPDRVDALLDRVRALLPA